MTKPSDIVAGLIALNTEKMIIGKTRLQKTFFLLDGCGLESGFEYDYHHFGPYSADLTDALESAIPEKVTQAEARGSHSVPYNIFSTSVAAPERIGALTKDKIISKLLILESYSSLELEIAATIVYFWQQGYASKAIDEVKKRKPVKASDERIERAQILLHQLEMDSTIH